MSCDTNHFREWMDLASAPRTALLIDDSQDETSLIVDMSKRFNIRWYVAHDGAEALELLRKMGKFQLIIMDLILHSDPEGTELFRKIKSLCPNCPVLILSGHITNDVIVETTQIGFVMFAQKPTAFTQEFFDQLFMALNVPKRQEVAEPKGYAI